MYFLRKQTQYISTPCWLLPKASIVVKFYTSLGFKGKKKIASSSPILQLIQYKFGISFSQDWREKMFYICVFNVEKIWKKQIKWSLIYKCFTPHEHTNLFLLKRKLWDSFWVFLNYLIYLYPSTNTHIPWFSDMYLFLYCFYWFRII